MGYVLYVSHVPFANAIHVYVWCMCLRVAQGQYELAVQDYSKAIECDGRHFKV